jgi:hypothetical protein
MWHAIKKLPPGQLRGSATLIDGKQLTAVCRIKTLWYLHCCALPVFCCRGAGAPDRVLLLNALFFQIPAATISKAVLDHIEA